MRTVRSDQRSYLFVQELTKIAKRRGKARSDTVEFRYRQKYNLPATDERFLEATTEEMLVDLYAHQYFDNPKRGDEYEDPDFDIDAEMAAIEAEAEARAQINMPNDDWETLS